MPAPSDRAPSSRAPAEHAPSWYAATAHPARARPPLRGTLSVDVCVVGAGYTGCHAALELAERGYRVVVLEAERVGWGASGRNGGQVCTGFAHGQEAIERTVGPADAHKLFALAEEAKRLLAERIERHAIDCDLKWGYLYAAFKERQLADCRADCELLKGRYGYESASILEKADLQAHIDSDAYVGGLYDGGAGHLHPLNYALGLAAAAEAAGATIHEASRVTRVTPGRKVALEVEGGGRVTADFVLLAGNAYLGDLVPAIRRTVMPVATYMTATEVLGENRAASLMPSDIAIGDCNFVLNYFRRSADHRLLFGGGVSYTAAMPASLPAKMRRSMLKIFPQLADTRQDFTWGGNVAITQDRAPHFGRVSDNILFAQGFSGQGVALTAIAGRTMAEAVAGQAERFDVFCKLPHNAFPGGKYLRTPTLALAMLWFRLRDMI